MHITAFGVKMLLFNWVCVCMTQVSHLFNDPSVGDVIRLALVKVVILESYPVRHCTLH